MNTTLRLSQVFRWGGVCVPGGKKLPYFFRNASQRKYLRKNFCIETSGFSGFFGWGYGKKINPEQPLDDYNIYRIESSTF